jgi:hypothetical protein
VKGRKEGERERERKKDGRTERREGKKEYLLSLLFSGGLMYMGMNEPELATILILSFIYRSKCWQTLTYISM